ncbi:MAG: hypothetical protein AVDCRST_MAG56-5284, partial [uncultured Cytophagales bacterium]
AANNTLFPARPGAGPGKSFSAQTSSNRAGRSSFTPDGSRAVSAL